LNKINPARGSNLHLDFLNECIPKPEGGKRAEKGKSPSSDSIGFGSGSQGGAGGVSWWGHVRGENKRL